MAFIVFILLVIVLLLYIVFSKRKKRAVLTSLGIIVLYHLYVTYTCGPNPLDVRVMKPMAEAMKSYIVQHGMPKNLRVIPNLPYLLSEDKNNPEFYHFKTSDGYYTIFKKTGYMLEFQSETKRGNGYTWFWLIFDIDKNGSYKPKREEFFLTHTSGICSTFKQ